MVVGVISSKQDDGSLLAYVVAAADRDQLQKFDVRIAGLVAELGNNSFTIEARNGEIYRILVTSDTRFRGMRGQIESLDDLHVDMRVVIAGKELGQGQYQYQAKLVIVLPKLR
jgi:hypothetical protein